MTVAELIKALEKLPPNKNVVVQYRNTEGDCPGWDKNIYLYEVKNVVLL